MQTHFTPKANHSSLVFAGSRVVGQVCGAGFAVSRGFGAQIALPLSYFSIDGNPPTSGPAKVQQRPAEVQPRLF